MFTHSRLLLEQYYCALVAKAPSRHADYLLGEVRGRLRRLQWTYDRLLVLDSELDTAMRADFLSDKPQPDVLKQIFHDNGRPQCSSWPDASLPFTKSDEVFLLLEGFYYTAHRIRDILLDGHASLPGITRFDARGVREVRNHLVEHPHKAKGVLLASIATGGPVGPQMRPVRWSLDVPGTEDAGLRENAATFREALERTLVTAIATCTA